MLIVDDEKWTREVIKQFGQWDRYQIEVAGEASNGKEAIELIEELGPDIVITDMKMPGVDGMELLQVVKERFPHIQLIVASGYDDFVYMRQAIRSKAREYLLKPINPDDLNLAIERCMEEIKKQSGLVFYQPFSIVNQDVSQLIIEYKKAIASFLQDLNVSGFENALQRFYRELQSFGPLDHNLLLKIHHEFIAILEEQMVKHNCKIANFFGSPEELEFTSQGMLDHQLSLGKNFMESIIQLNKKKSRVDLQVIKEYIDRNYTDSDISLEILANKFFVSKEYLSKAFKLKYECNITEYIVSHRMEQAKKLIQDNELQIKSIAQRVGYEDVSYFYRVFKKYFKISPGEMRTS